MKQCYKQTDIGLIPEDWDVIPFSKCFDTIKNNNLSRAELNCDGGNIRNIHYGDVLINFPSIVDCQKETIPFINEDATESAGNSFLQDGDIVIADTAEDNTVGKSVEVFNIGDSKVVAGLHTMPCRPKNKFAVKFLGYYINARVFHDQIIPFITGTKVSSISKKAIDDTTILVPPFAEQKRIAEALSDVDEMIASLEKLIEKKKALKQGAMQELLTGKRRLPGFSGDWVKEKISDIFELIKGNGLSKNCLIDNGKNKCILYGELFTHYKEVIDTIISYTNENAGLKSRSFDVLMPGSTTTNGSDLATASVILDDGVLLGGDIVVLRPKCLMDSRVFGYLMRLLSKDISICTQGITIIHLNTRSFLDMQIYIPADFEEQKAIADILLDIDGEIGELEQKLSKVRKIKAGMMSELLTGKIRLV